MLPMQIVAQAFFGILFLASLCVAVYAATLVHKDMKRRKEELKNAKRLEKV